jgi:hypothetical protein
MAIDFPFTNSCSQAMPARRGQTKRHRISFSAWGSLQAVTLGVSACIIFLLPGTARATNLKPETVAAWNAYVRAANLRMKQRPDSGRPFLVSDEDPSRAARLRRGEFLVSPVDTNTPKRVSGGLIHDWVGQAFIPNSSLHDVLTVVRDYRHYKEFYQPGIIDSKAIANEESEDRFSILLMNKSLISRTALQMEFRSAYFHVSERRWYSVTESTRIQEIAGYGTGDQHALPEDEGTGLIWRTYSTTRFEERDGGVYVELEAIVLSRDIPFSLHWIVEPIVRRVSRQSFLTSFQQTQNAVRTAARRDETYSASSSRQKPAE